MVVWYCIDFCRGVGDLNIRKITKVLVVIQTVVA